tara:strand:- start:2007 stop:2144 length:138 start_codon:yes stop_codon:yes gene_type:complete
MEVVIANAVKQSWGGLCFVIASEARRSRFGFATSGKIAASLRSSQ